MRKENTVCVDFDWTLCSNDSFGEPNNDVVELVKKLWAQRYEICIYTSRQSSAEIKQWLREKKLDMYIGYIFVGKPEAVVYIDDRALEYPFNLDCDMLSDGISYESTMLIKRKGGVNKP